MQAQAWFRSSNNFRSLSNLDPPAIDIAMAPGPAKAYTSDHAILEDGSVTFACSGDMELWPWLKLPAQHPIVIQTQNYWTSVGASAALGTLDEGKWSALTWTDWVLHDHSATHATRGIFARTLVEDKLAFETRLFDQDEKLIVTMRGRGVVFRTRNFEEWREGTKRKLADQSGPTGFRYAPRELLNLSGAEVPLVSELDGPHAAALITKENGLMPGHPYFSGSGDHVNAPHLAEVARQVASQINAGMPLLVVSGEMDMYRYVELGIKFDVRLLEHAANSATMEIAQKDRSCAKLSLNWETIRP